MSDGCRKRFRCRKVTLLVFLALFVALSLSPAAARPAEAWDAIPAAAYKRMLDTIYDRIQGTILAALKQAAAKTVNDLVSKLVSGGSGGSPKFITDWQDYLVSQPGKLASKYLNDYLGKVTGGMGSPNFVPSSGWGGYALAPSGSEGFARTALAADSGSSSSGSYASSLVSMAKSSTSELSDSDFQLTYTSDPSSMFDSGNLRDFNSFLSGVNNPWAFDIHSQDVWQRELSNQMDIANAKSVAYSGYIGTGEKDGSGAIRTPGSNTKDAVSNAQDLGNKILAAATHPEEVIVSVVTQLITKAIEQGISNVANIASSAISGSSSSSDSSSSNVSYSMSGSLVNGNLPVSSGTQEGDITSWGEIRNEALLGKVEEGYIVDKDMNVYAYFTGDEESIPFKFSEADSALSESSRALMDIHTHPLGSFPISDEDKQAVLDGKMSPPAMPPSAVDILSMATKFAKKYGSRYKNYVVDPSGYWEFELDPSNRIIALAIEEPGALTEEEVQPYADIENLGVRISKEKDSATRKDLIEQYIALCKKNGVIVRRVDLVK